MIRFVLFIGAFAAILSIVGCASASGSSIVTGTTRSPIPPERVQIYLEPPAEYEVVGLVSAASDVGWTEQESLDYAIQELKEQAAKIGANGVILVATGEKTTSAVVGRNYEAYVAAKTVEGKAIFIQGK